MATTRCPNCGSPVDRADRKCEECDLLSPYEEAKDLDYHGDASSEQTRMALKRTAILLIPVVIVVALGAAGLLGDCSGGSSGDFSTTGGGGSDYDRRRR